MMQEAFEQYEAAVRGGACDEIVSLLRNRILIAGTYIEENAKNELNLANLIIESNDKGIEDVLAAACRVIRKHSDERFPVERNPETLEEAVKSLDLILNNSMPIRRVMIINDLAIFSGYECVELLNGAREMGLGNYSVNMEIKIEDAVNLINYLNSKE